MTRVILGWMTFLACSTALASSADPKQTVATLPVEAVSCQDGKDCSVIRLQRESIEASLFRGKVVYHNYCVICHGKDYDGNGRVAKIHNPKPVNLIMSRLPGLYVQEIVRKGGEGVGRYKGMPPFEEQLTEEQLTDVFNFIMSLRAQ